MLARGMMNEHLVKNTDDGQNDGAEIQQIPQIGEERKFLVEQLNERS